MFNLNDDQAKIQMNNFWNYLDELAEKNPEEYQKFISQQMKKGVENIKQEKEEKIQSQEKILKPNLYLCLRFKILSILKHDNTIDNENIKIHGNSKNEISEVPKILFSYEFQSSAFGSKILDQPKVYLNISHSSEFKKPTDEKGSELSDKDVNDDNKWKYIPTQFRYNGKKSSMSGKRCDFYDVIINSLVIKKLNSSEELKSSILAYIVRKFGIFLDNKYKLFTDNVKILGGKKYKSLKSLPEDFKIGGEAPQPEKSNLKNNLDKNFIPSTTTPTPTPAKNFYEENKIIIPNVSENYPGTSSFYNVPKTEISTSAGGNSKPIPGIFNPGKPKNNPQKIQEPPQPKKILIQEIPIKEKQKLLIPIKKNILSDSQMEVKFDFSEFENITMEKLDLQISENEIKLKLENTQYVENDDYEPVDMKFNFCVDADSCTAKFNKLEKHLKLVLVKKI
jgi:hypothetical protein